MQVNPFISYLDKNKTILSLFVLSIIGYLLTYLFSVVLSHYLNAIRFGEFNIALRVLNLLTSLALLGTNMASRKFVSQFLRKHDKKNLVLYITWNIHLIRMSFACCLLFALISYVMMNMLHIWHIKDIKTYHMAIYMLWIAPLASLLTLFESYLLCANHPILSNILYKIRPLSYIFFFLLTIVFYDVTVNSRVMVLPLFLSFFCLLIIEIIIITRKIPVIFNGLVTSFMGKNNAPPHENWLPASLRLTANNLLFLVITTIDLLLVQFICPNKEAVGQYAVVLTIASVIFVVPQNLYANIKANVSQLIETSSGRLQLQNKIKQPNRYALMVILLVGSAIFYYSNTLLGHFGPIYIQAKRPLLIATIGFMVAGFSQAATSIIAYSGYEKLLLQISIIECGLLLMLGIILTYFLGITGTAIASSAVMIFKSFVFHIESYRKFGIKTFYI